MSKYYTVGAYCGNCDRHFSAKIRKGIPSGVAFKYSACPICRLKGHLGGTYRHPLRRHLLPSAVIIAAYKHDTGKLLGVE